MAEKIDPDDLIDSSGVAKLIGLASAGAVRVYRSRYEDFPVPRISQGRCQLWDRNDIHRWVRDRSRNPRTSARD